ncbi:MAG TPA: glycosyltransferase family A protein [Jatrophihabitans sp.]|uniref:glycosyltransferase family 2 protein n=1 Tax=Jatrophihabitans sp. TaxID=1932789 RepID=UPI002F12A940
MPTKVSVVIPVWNPGRFLDRCIDSLLAQTMPSTDFEVLFMDDGSTDGTEDRLDRLAAEHPHFRVHHLENSGWPGKPRNVGIERAAGDYVLFLDNDDALGAEALERMHAIGARNHSDIVIGKVVSNFRGVPHQVFRTTREHCTVRDAPLFESLTPHKMFRRQFLLDHDIRYPEGKRRLEDQLIMARAYFPARSVSIVGDYVCYYYLKREDGTNAGSARIDPKSYYDNLREVLDVVEANTEPGEFRDSIQRRFYRGEMLGRLSGRAVLRYPPRFRDDLLAEVRRLALDPRFAPGVHAGLPAFLRVRSYFVRENLVDDLLTYSERCLEIAASARLEDMRWRDGVLVLTVRAWFARGEQPLEFLRTGQRLFLTPEITLDAPPDERDCTGQLAQVLADASIKNRDTADEFFLPAELRLHERTVGELAGSSVVQAEWVGEVEIDPTSALGGRPLPRGVWDVSIRLSGLGLARKARLGSERDRVAEQGRRPALLGDRPLVAIPYWTTPHGNLSLDIAEHTMSLRDILKRVPATASPPWQLGAASLRISLPIAVSPVRPIDGRLRLIHRRTGAVVECPLECGAAASTLRLTAELPARDAGLTVGVWDIAVVLPDLGRDQPVRISQVLAVPRIGPPHLRRAPRSVLVRGPRALARRGKRLAGKAAALIRRK